MFYYLIALIYCLILAFSLVQIFTFLFKTKSNMIYLNRNYIYLPGFLVLVSGLTAFLGLSKQQIETYDTNTILISSLFCFSFLLVGSVLIYLISSWKVVIKDSYLEYTNHKESNGIIQYEDIVYIDAFRPTSNGIIYIKTKDNLLKINHNIITGNISGLTQLICKYRKKK